MPAAWSTAFAEAESKSGNELRPNTAHRPVTPNSPGPGQDRIDETRRVPAVAASAERTSHRRGRAQSSLSLRSYERRGSAERVALQATSPYSASASRRARVVGALPTECPELGSSAGPGAVRRLYTLAPGRRISSLGPHVARWSPRDQETIEAAGRRPVFQCRACIPSARETGGRDRAPCRGVADQGVGVRGRLPGAHT